MSKSVVCPSRLGFFLEFGIQEGGTLAKGVGVLIKPLVDHRWRADIWMPGEFEELKSISDWISDFRLVP